MITAGEACRGVAWDGSVGRGSHDLFRQVASRRDPVGLGRRGVADQGKASHDGAGAAWPGASEPSSVGRGQSGHRRAVSAWCGMARQLAVGPGAVRHGRRGAIRQGWAAFGRARLGAAGRGGAGVA
jgi:hypothetical protein